jgi:hypothetical protein
MALPSFNEEMGVAVEAQISTADTILVGRKSYETSCRGVAEAGNGRREDAVTAKKLGDETNKC